MWRAFDKAVRRKPLGGAADAVYGIQSILAWKSLEEEELREKLIIDVHRCTAPRIHRRHPSAGRLISQDHVLACRIDTEIDVRKCVPWRDTIHFSPRQEELTSRMPL
jgi:hypothetical protein